MSPLVGIARAAAESPTLEAKLRTEYFELDTHRFIGRCSGTRMPFVWTLNPYRGCEYGCKYCYARYTHEFMELRDPELFERKIYAKRFDSGRFRTELRRIALDDSIWIGTATDPYQPAERRFGITRRILEVLAEGGGRVLGLTTKSDLAARDSTLLGSISRANVFCLHMTITTLDENLARQLEPLAPRPALRLEAVRKLTAAGVRVAVLSCPVMPLINDAERSLDAVCAAAVEAGASSFHASPLFLRPPAKQVFLRFIDEHYPALAGRYHERFDEKHYLSGEYPKMIRERVASIVASRGIAARMSNYDPPEWRGDPQMVLFESDQKWKPRRLP